MSGHWLDERAISDGTKFHALENFQFSTAFWAYQMWYVTWRLSVFGYLYFGTDSGLLFGGTKVFTSTPS